MAGSNTVGKDTNNDGHPDIPLTYTFKESDTRVEFPLRFCPGKRFSWEDEQGERHTQMHVTPDPVGMPCVGYWGIAIKEWQVIKQVGVFSV